MTYNPDNQKMYLVNSFAGAVSVIVQNNDMVDTAEIGEGSFAIVFNPVNENMHVVNAGSDTASVIGVKPSVFEGIFGSGNNINIQVQENSGNNVGEQSGFGGTYSDSYILQDQLTKQDSNAAS